MQYLFQKNKNPLNLGTYSPESDKLTCVKDKEELTEFFDKNLVIAITAHRVLPKPVVNSKVPLHPLSTHF